MIGEKLPKTWGNNERGQNRRQKFIFHKSVSFHT